MVKQFFNAHALDELIDESLKDADQLKMELNDINARRGTFNS